MGTAKRERQKAGRQARLDAAKQQVARSKRNRQIARVSAIVAALLVLALLYSVFGRGGDDDTEAVQTVGATTTAAPGETTTSAAGASTTAAGTATTGSAAASALAAPPAGETISGATPCPPAAGADRRVSSFAQAPPLCIDPAKAYKAVVSTTEGDFTIVLDAKAAPKTVNNFVVLSRYRYYDNVPFHRIVTGFVAQAGDANPRNGQLGAGGPGYQFADELPSGLDQYKNGSVAMANSGKDTNGSQFFVLVGSLPTAAYSLFGQVTDGLDTTVKTIMAAGSASGTPSKAVLIRGVTIQEG
ncbi:MAG: peptidylprolyl isomerase [Acidimicrobiales bacterium]